MSIQHTSELNAAQKRWADGLKQLDQVARNAKQAEAIDVLHTACQEMAQLQIQRDEMLAALREIAALNGIYCGAAVELARAAIAKTKEQS